jgi:NAD(P)-dependent dehydrogenase (short-subunit alcohol dehydrogenase family)
MTTDSLTPSPSHRLTVSGLQGRPIAITGASSGIGLSTALACARAGMPVALGARRIDRLNTLAAEITAAGGRAIAVEVDVTKPDDCRRLIDRTVEAFGSIYAVFANAGYGFEAPVHEVSDEQLRAIFETNFFGTLNTIRPALERMLPAKSGHILICSSCIAKIGIPFLGPYCATKGAQNLIGRAMRHELAPLGIYVSTVHPVGTRTEFFNKPGAFGPDAMPSRAPDAFMQSPERVANAIVRCLRRRPPPAEVWTSLPARLGFATLNAFPGAADFVFRRFVARRSRSAQERE